MTPKTRTSKTRTVAAVDALLRGKLIDVRDSAMELSAILEFAKPDGAAADPLWKFAQTVIRGDRGAASSRSQKRRRHRTRARRTVARVAELPGGALRGLLPGSGARRPPLRSADCTAIACPRRAKTIRGG